MPAPSSARDLQLGLVQSRVEDAPNGARPIKGNKNHSPFSQVRGRRVDGKGGVNFAFDSRNKKVNPLEQKGKYTVPISQKSLFIPNAIQMCAMRQNKAAVCQFLCILRLLETFH